MTITKKLLILGVIAGILVALFAFLPNGIKGKFLGSSSLTGTYVATGKFVTTWKTDNPGVSTASQITISTNPGINPNTGANFVYNYIVDWGDGTTDTEVTGDKVHTYATPGTYTVTISGTFPSLYFLNAHNPSISDSQKLLTVEEWGSNIWQSFENAFYGSENLIINARDIPDLTAVKSMAYMFAYTTKFNSNINNWNVSNVVNMNGMFYNAWIFNQDLSNWNTGKVTDMRSMFDTALAFNGNIGNWNVGNVTNMNNMFNNAYVFNKDISNWNVGNVTNMGYMFSGAKKFNQDIGRWNVSEVNSMDHMFLGTSDFNKDISNWNVSKVTNMMNMFSSATSFDQNLSKWERTSPTVSTVGNVTNMQNMFNNCKANYDISNWNVGNVIDMSGMFATAGFNQDISRWDVSKVMNMSAMFANNLVFNKPLNAWGEKTANVRNMSKMFEGAIVFNQPLNFWNVSKVENMNNMFAFAEAFNGDVTAWNVSESKDMSGMFASTKAFNQDLSKWERTTSGNISTVGNVRGTGCMFCGARAFNSDISNWNVSNVQDMSNMFSHAILFNKPLNAWGEKTSQVITMQSMFEGAKAFNQSLGLWNVSSVRSMEDMFNNAKVFNQDLGSWNIAKVTTAANMFLGSALSMVNYHKLFQGWSSRSVLPNVDFGASSTYCGADASTARDILTMAPNNWRISDGGVDLLLCPGTPANLRATIKDSGRVELMWDISVASGAPAITDYIIQYKTAAGTWMTYDDGISASKPATVSMTFENNIGYNFRVAAKNINETGNYSSASNTVIIDTIAPVVSETFSVPELHNSLTVPVTGFTATDAVGVTGYLITATNTPPTAATTGWRLTAPTTYAFPTGTIDGDKTLHAWAKDAIGNISLSRNDSVILDTTAPIISSFSAPADSASHSISISVLTIDDTAAKYLITESATSPIISATWASIPARPFVYVTSSDGAKTLYAWAKDAAGNISNYFARQITVDTIAPVVTTFTFPSASNTLTDILLTLTATDAVGVTGYALTTSSTPPATTDAVWSATAPTKYTFPTGTTDGSYTLYAWAKDAAGRISAVKSTTITIDRVAPTITAFAIPSTSLSRTVSITTFTPSETIAGTRYLITEANTPPLVTAAGWSETLPTSYSVSTDGSKTLYAWVKDAAGNISPAFIGRSIMIDATAPVITTFTVPTPVNSLTIQNISLTATDAVGITGYMITNSSTAPAASSTSWVTTGTPTITPPTSYPFPTGTLAGTKRLYAWARDAAGNVSLGSEKIVEIDTTKPTTPPLPTIVPQTGVFEISPTNIETNTSSITFKVMCTPGDRARIQYGLGLSVVSPQPCPAIGYTTLSIPLSTDTRYYTIYATTTDPAGNISDPSPTLSLYKNPSATNSAPGIPDLDTYYDSGISSTDNITREARPTFTASCIAGYTVTFYDTNTLIATTTCMGNTVGSTAGTAQFIPAQDLSSGTHSITAKQVSSTGVVSLLSNPLSLTIDAIPPTITLSKAAGQSDPATSASLGFIATFTSPIITNSFSCSHVNLVNGVCNSITPLSENIYTINVTATNPGAVRIAIPAGSLQTLSGNSNLDSTGTNTITYVAGGGSSTVTRVNGACNPSLTVFLTSTPTKISLSKEKLCKAGTSTTVTYNPSKKQWDYTCNGKSGGTKATCTVSAVLNSARTNPSSSTCDLKPVAIPPFESCSIASGTDFFRYHSYLSCLNIIAQKKSCTDAGCTQNAPRQELISIAARLRGIPLEKNYQCQKKYTDTSSKGTPSWVCEVAEKAQIAGLITANNKTFRPLDTMTRAEAFKVILGSICISPETTTKSWQTDIAKVAIKAGFTTRTVATFEPNRKLTKQELYVLSARAAEWYSEHPDNCEALPDELICE